jgi:hypothetical protein
MRTKTLALAAVACAVGIATASAQAVYSVNVVGYINVEAPPGFSIIANQLDNGAGNDLRDLVPSAPDGTTVYKFTGAGYDILSYDEIDEAWTPLELVINLNPGDAAFVRNPTASPITMTFVGEVLQGNLVNSLPAGFSMKSSIVPQAGTISQLGLAGQDGDTVYQFDNAASAYVINSFDEIDEAWAPAEPTLGVGEGFFFRNPTTTARQWTRDFSVN